MKKYVSLLIAVCVLSLCLSACGTEEPKGGMDPQETAQAEPTETVTAITEPPDTALEPYLTMDHYLLYRLPDSLAEGEHHWDQASLGGNVFLWKETGESEAKQAGEYTPIGWNAYGGVEVYYRLGCTFQDGRLTDVLLPWNHSMGLDKAEPVDGCDAPAVIIPIDHDLYTAPQIREYDLTAEEAVSEMWYVFFSREDSDIGYAVFLNRAYFSREDTIALAQSVRFKDGAFNIDVQ